MLTQTVSTIVFREISYGKGIARWSKVPQAKIEFHSFADIGDILASIYAHISDNFYDTKFIPHKLPKEATINQFYPQTIIED